MMMMMMLMSYRVTFLPPKSVYSTYLPIYLPACFHTKALLYSQQATFTVLAEEFLNFIPNVGVENVMSIQNMSGTYTKVSNVPNTAGRDIS